MGPNGGISCDFSGKRLVNIPEKRSILKKTNPSLEGNRFYGLEVHEVSSCSPFAVEKCVEDCPESKC